MPWPVALTQCVIIIKVPLECGNGSPTESLLAHIYEGCLTDKWIFDDKEGKLKAKNTKLSHLRRICEWLVKGTYVPIFIMILR